MWSITIGFLVFVLQAYSIEEFLLEQSRLIELACSNADFMRTLSSPYTAEMCEKRMKSDRTLLCSGHYEVSYTSPYTLELFSQRSESLGKYSCKLTNDFASNNIPYFFNVSDVSHLIINTSHDNNLIELLFRQNMYHAPRKLQNTCTASIAFNTVTYT
jgi:hypothetical protein